MRVLRASADSGGPDSAPSSESGAFRAKQRVLVVDHDAGTARRLALALELEGLDTEVADGAEQALAILAENRTLDLVLIELMLPRQSGLELARELAVRYPDLRVVLTGAYHLSERQLTRAGCNAVAFVPKPCDPSVVAAFVKRKAAEGPQSTRF
jgi:DNA-binding NtrC family response regulator